MFDSVHNVSLLFNKQWLSTITTKYYHLSEDDILGSVAYGCYDSYAVIGVYYVTEEYRHSGIGEKLFREVLKRLSGKSVIFHSS